jgi:RimJ/RimL family protein N-acetyltransferase
VIETDRLLLRLPEPADADGWAVAVTDPQVMQYIGSGETGTRDDAVRAIERYLGRWRDDGFGMFAVVRRDDRRFVGRVGLLAWDPTTWEHATHAEIGPRAEIEIGWTLARHAWGAGYATEAAVAVRDWAFREVRPRRLISLIHPANERSLRVAAKLGERYEREIVTAAGHVAQLWST